MGMAGVGSGSVLKQEAVVEYIELFHNRRLRHSSLDYLSPAEYGELALAA
jgi:transposase InsO family protein